MEVQQHGNYYEDIKTKEITGFSKEEYDSLKSNGYTSSMDICKGLYSDDDYSIKTAKGDKVDCGDVIRRRKEKEYNIIIGVWSQNEDYKIFHTEYTFFIRPEHETLLWGNMSLESLTEYDQYIKSIPAGKEGQQKTKTKRQQLKEQLEDKAALMRIHPKVDSKKQRRVQCSFKIKELVKANIPHKVSLIRETCFSPSRKFN